MIEDDELPLDISEFTCVAVDPAVVVVFSQTNRRYTYAWSNGELGLATPAIEGQCWPHAPEIVDCLARAVAYHAGRGHAPHPLPPAAPIAARPISSFVRHLFFARS